jgi:hypothetical protein
LKLLIFSSEIKRLEKKDLVGNSNSVTLNFCLHISRNTINCIFLFTFMKQLKPVKDDNEKESKEDQRTKRTRKYN